ncbi:MAG: DUF1841 family protein [Variovorax sp.]
MFNPTQQDVRRFFCNVYTKGRLGEPMEALELIASHWVDAHPEFHGDLGDVEAALDCVYDGSAGRENPFLHLSMHLSISEQCSIDQPRGIRQAVELLAHRRGSLLDAHHAAMECLGRMMWESQRLGHSPDGEAYVACVQRQATKD